MAATLVDYGRWYSIEPKPKDVMNFKILLEKEKLNWNIYIYIGNRKIANRASGTGKKPLYPIKNKHFSNTHEYNIYGITLVLKVFGSFIK